MSTFDHIMPGQYGEFEIVSRTPTTHSHETFRMIYQYTVSYSGYEFKFLTNDRVSFLMEKDNEDRIAEFLMFKFMENWFPVKSGGFYIKSTVSHRGSADSIPDIDKLLLRDYDENMYNLIHKKN